MVPPAELDASLPRIVVLLSPLDNGISCSRISVGHGSNMWVKEVTLPS
jgi:hypothetical protein